MTVIELRNLTQAYGSHIAVHRVNLSLSTGAFGLLGPNGAGKTSLLRTLATRLAPRDGELLFRGTDLRSQKALRAARREIGFLPQSFRYPGDFSVYEFVSYCAWLREIPDRQIKQATCTALERTGMSDHAKTPMRKLSGGMLRRAGIAQAIAGTPELIILDEPTTGLDPRQRTDFRKLIRYLSDSSCVVLSTHIAEDVSHTCARVGVLHEGALLFQGESAELESLAVPDSEGDTEFERGYISVIEGRREA
ncbi:ATP-binding cassette domain-containing protein [Streptomyces sp. NPDC018029]|uniref:ATP-binding cassette domain-containing protein n=1 Tax=Streptomyces sp. NPDC018029 TaxID=3365032 RepID=UPI0037A6C098